MPASVARHILTPVDFSELSAHALRYAARLANCSGARLTALYADLFQPPPYFTEGSLAQLEEQLRAAEQQAETHLRRFVAAQAPDLPDGQVLVREGLPADAIRRTALEERADLIVMGTHGRSGLNRLMLGSVTEHVLRESTIPVLAVRGDWAERPIRRILCPVNDSQASRQALQTAAALAGCLGATISVFHARQPGAQDSIADLCAWIPEPQRELCSVTESSGTSDVAEEVLSVAAQSQVDLLVLGARHRRFFDTTVLGANTIRMLRHSHCPVLAVFTSGEGR